MGDLVYPLLYWYVPLNGIGSYSYHFIEEKSGRNWEERERETERDRERQRETERDRERQRESEGEKLKTKLLFITN